MPGNACPPDGEIDDLSLERAFRISRMLRARSLQQVMNRYPVEGLPCR
jgi:hypothetical protein